MSEGIPVNLVRIALSFTVWANQSYGVVHKCGVSTGGKHFTITFHLSFLGEKYVIEIFLALLFVEEYVIEIEGAIAPVFTLGTTFEGTLCMVVFGVNFLVCFMLIQEWLSQIEHATLITLFIWS